MSKVTARKVAALRWWAMIVANITPYQRKQIAAVCDAVDERDARIAALTAALTDAADILWDTGGNNALARRLDALTGTATAARDRDSGLPLRTSPTEEPT